MAGLAGCSDQGTTTHSFVYAHDIPGHVQYAAANGPVPVAIFRDPFPNDPANAAVLAAMQHRNPGPPVTFVNATSAPGSGAYRVIVAFGTPRVAGCRAPAASAPAPEGTDVSAAFCTGDHLISEAWASGGRIDTAEDPRFARLMQDLLSALMPYNDPSLNNTGGSGGAM
ncbi:MAG TPA: hypothetical protein VGB82_16820 [Alphaproteobacteria bacterium]